MVCCGGIHLATGILAGDGMTHFFMWARPGPARFRARGRCYKSSGATKLRCYEAQVQARVFLRESGVKPPHSAWAPRGYQTWQTFSGGLTMGWPGLQAKAAANSGMFTTTPLMRYLPGECGSVTACTRSFSGRVFSQAHCAKPTKKRWSGVRPSRCCKVISLVASFHAM